MDRLLGSIDSVGPTVSDEKIVETDTMTEGGALVDSIFEASDTVIVDSSEVSRPAIARHVANLSDSTRRRPSLSRTRIKAGNDDTTRIVRTKVDLDNSVDFSAADYPGGVIVAGLDAGTRQ